MRQIKPATVVGAPSGIAIKTRLHPSEEDEIALRALADLQGSLSGKDLRAALAGKTRQERKLALTAQSSSRWAGTWTGDNDAQVALATMAQRAHRDSVRAAIAAIEAAGTVLSVGASYVLHRTGHHRLERWASILHIGIATAGGIWNCTLPNGL